MGLVSPPVCLSQLPECQSAVTSTGLQYRQEDRSVRACD